MGKDGSPGFCFVDTDTQAIKQIDLIAIYKSD
jgi:hypothetical protein